MSKMEIKCPRCKRHLGKVPPYGEEASGETMLLKCQGCNAWVDVPVPVERPVSAA